MFYRINNDNIVNLRDVSYVSIVQNEQSVWELRIFMKQVEHYMFIQYDSKENAVLAFELMANELINLRQYRRVIKDEVENENE